MEVNEKKLIEDLLWTDVFQENILKFTLSAIVLIVFMRLICILIKSKTSKASTYLIKSVMYSYIVCMLVVYFYKVENSINAINIFTGFTFLLSTVEVFDNLGQAVQEIFDTNIIFNKSKLFKKEEENFTKFIVLLCELEQLIQPGQVSDKAINYMLKIRKDYEKYEFYQINSILNNVTETENAFSNSLTKLIYSDTFLKLFRYGNEKNKKAYYLNKIKSDELKELIIEICEYRNKFSKEKRRLIELKTHLDLIN